MDKEEYEKLKKELKLPKVEMTKGVVRKTRIDKTGKTYEVEETIELPVIHRREDKK